MASQIDIERLFEYLDQSVEVLKPWLQGSSIKAFSETLHYLMNDEITLPMKESVLETLKALKVTISDETFAREAMRKSCQLMLLKVFKEERYSNAMMTPDTIGLLIGYLISHLYDEHPAVIFDPLVGTGNLLASIPQVNEADSHLIGVDDDPLMADVAHHLLDALGFQETVYLQDTFTFDEGSYPCIVTDFPIHKKDSKEAYFPYQVILWHILKVPPKGHFIAVIENDFFTQRGHEEFKEKLSKVAHLYGLIKLDETLFKNHPKSVLILQRKQHGSDTMDDFLLADLPPISEEEAFRQTLARIDQWFAHKKG